MDPITQGMTGAIAAGASAKKSQARNALIIGWISGMAADLDMLVRSSTDSLVNLLFHRHFTHSLVFAPIGGVLTALLLWPLFRKQLSFKFILLYASIGYATHGLLDACTSYGTYILWPFSNERIAWDTMSIIDPVFSMILGGAILFAFLRNRPGIAGIGAVLGAFYLILGGRRPYLYERHALSNRQQPGA